jgi:hypothetical protein
MKQKPLDDEAIALLKQWADMLPVVMHQTHEVHIMTGAELLEMGYVEREGKKIDPEEDYRYNQPVQIAANHFRRMKNAWHSNGEAGVIGYIESVKRIAVLENKKVKNERGFAKFWMGALSYLQSKLWPKRILQPQGQTGAANNNQAKEKQLHSL